MDSKDHDLLIKLDTKMTIMCKTLTKMIEDNSKDHKEIYDLLDKKIDVTNDKIDKKVDFKYFRILIGILITVGIIFGTAGISHVNTAYKDNLELKTSINHYLENFKETPTMYKIPKYIK